MGASHAVSLEEIPGTAITLIDKRLARARARASTRSRGGRGREAAERARAAFFLPTTIWIARGLKPRRGIPRVTVARYAECRSPYRYLLGRPIAPTTRPAARSAHRRDVEKVNYGSKARAREKSARLDGAVERERERLVATSRRYFVFVSRRFRPPISDIAVEIEGACTRIFSSVR